MHALKIVGLAAGIASAGCKPSQLDDAVAHAPVLSISDVAGAIVPIEHDAGSTAAGRFLWSNGTTLAVAELDATGNKVTQRRASQAVLEPLNESPVMAAAYLPGEKVLLGIPAYQGKNGGAWVMALDAAFTPATTRPFGGKITAPLSNPEFGGSVAAASLTGDGANDLVIRSSNFVHLFAGGDAGKEIRSDDLMMGCPLTGDNSIDGTISDDNDPANHPRRTIAVANLVDDNDSPGNEIAVGVAAGRRGGVRILRYLPPDASNQDGALACVTTIAAPASPPQMLDSTTGGNFGTEIASGDFDGDGHADLVVAAPPDSAFVFYGPFTPIVGHGSGVNQADAWLTPPSGAALFGASVAAADVDGDGVDEILVGDPRKVLDGKQGAGQVTIFSVKGRPQMPVVLAVLADRVPAEAALFGATVAGISFCPGGVCAPERLVVVGAGGKTYVYFRLIGAAGSGHDEMDLFTDPRAPAVSSSGG